MSILQKQGVGRCNDDNALFLYHADHHTTHQTTHLSIGPPKTDLSIVNVIVLICSWSHINYVLSLTKSSKYLRVSIGVDQRIFVIFSVFAFCADVRNVTEQERGEERGRREKLECIVST